MGINDSARSALIVSSGEKGGDYLREMLTHEGYDPLTVVATGGDARRQLVTGGFDLIVINAPLSDEFGHELALDAASATAAGVMLLVKNEVFDEICARVEMGGVLTISRPVNRVLFHQGMRLIEALEARQQRYAREKQQLEVKLEEVRLVSRAKCTLMEYLGMSEANAHRYIEKQAMNMRATKREIAENILRAYNS